MDVENLLKELRRAERYCLNDYSRLAGEAATALSTLQAENAQLRESRDHWKRLAHELSEGVNGKDAEHERLQSENAQLRAELERMKKIMRDNGIMTIPPKYPGGPTEWNIPKPRSQKED